MQIRIRASMQNRTHGWVVSRKALAFILFAAFTLSCAISSPGQTNAATLSGAVTDTTGAVIPEAAITLENTATGVTRTGRTNRMGQFVMPALEPGLYVLRAQKAGFAIAAVEGITLHTSTAMALVIKMNIGTQAQEVEVHAGELTNDSSAVSLTVTQDFVDSVPLNGRSFQDLIQLAPGVVSQRGNFSIDGQRTNANVYTVDGVSTTLGGFRNSNSAGGAGLGGDSPAQTALGTTQSMVSVDALKEFTIQGSGYLPEYGRSPGGQIQFTTRSGTNATHGSLFEYLRNTLLDANSLENDYYGYPKTGEHQNDFGGTVGGRLKIPGLYDGKDRTFYFFSYEGLRLLMPAFESEYVPTKAFRLAASPDVQPFLASDPLPNPTSPGNTDGCTVTDPTTAGPAACDALFSYGYSYPNTLNNFSIRVDHSFTSKTQFFLRYGDTPSHQTTGAEASQYVGINTHTWTAALTQMISKSLVNDFRFNYSRDGEELVGKLRSIGGSVPFSRSLMIPSQYENPYDGAIVMMTVPGSGLFSLFEYNGENTVQHQYQLVDGFTWTRGKHNMKFGLDWRRLTPTYQQQPYTDFIDIASLAGIQNGVATTQTTSANTATSALFNNLSLYAQDHWNIRPRISVDYGIRWELNPAPGSENGIYPAVLSSSDVATATLAPLGTAPYRTQYAKFAPRLGVVWQTKPTSNHSLTIRAGGGIFYDTGQTIAGNAYVEGYPFSADKVSSNVPLPISGAAAKPPAVGQALAPPYPNLTALSSQALTLPYTEQWNLSLDCPLTRGNRLTVIYVGNNGRKLLFTQQYGDAPFGNQNFPNGLSFTNNAAQSSYNALQVQDSGHITTALDLVGSFTYGHTLDNSSDSSSSFAPQWGNSDYDLRRTVNIALNYRLSRVESNRVLRAVSSGWMIANRFSAQSGYPVNIVQSTIVSANGVQSQAFPDLVPGKRIYLHGSAADLNGGPVPGHWRVNRDAFACVPVIPDPSGSSQAPCDGTSERQGTLGRNYVRSLPFWTLNSSVKRTFHLHERLNLDVNVDAFNLLNHPNLGAPDTTLTDATFGEVLPGAALNTTGSANPLYSLGSPRSLQINARISF